MNQIDTILQHRNCDADDYAYLLAKGWTDAEILTRWDEEANAGNAPCRWQSESARSKLTAVTSRK